MSLAVLLGAALPASANISSGLYCNTVAQVERLYKHYNDGKTVEEAFNLVNQEYDEPDATVWVCAYGTIGYVKGEKKAEVTINTGVVGIYEATVMAYLRNGRLFPIMPPRTQYLPFMEKPTPVKHGTAI